MKIKSLILAMAACTGLFSACTNELDNGSTTGPNETAGKAFMTLTFSTPSAAGTRASAGQGGDGSIDATADEYKITDANIFLFGEDNLLKQVVSQAGSDLTDGTDNVQKTWTTDKISMIPGIYKVCVVVNRVDDELINLSAGTSLATFQEKVFKAAIQTANYCREGQFLMTNAKEMGTAAGQEGVVEVTALHTEQNPAHVTVHVERAAARVSFDIPTVQKVMKGENEIATVEFKSFKIINTRNGAFCQRRVTTGTSDFTKWTIGGEETSTNATTATNYVLDNIFAQKTGINFGGTTYTDNYSRKYNTYVAWRTLASTGKQTLAYCLENTMKNTDDVEGLVTTVVFRAKYTPTDNVNYIKGTKPENWDGTFYRYPKGSNSSILYYTLKDLIEGVYTSLANAKSEGRFGLTNVNIEDADELNSHLADLAADQDALFKEYSTEQYPQGYCYYTYFIRHADNGNSEERGVMEHVIVRNNVYALSITKVGNLGSISSGTNGPDEDDLVDNPKYDPSKPAGPDNLEKVPGPGIDEPNHGTDKFDPSNPEIPGTVDPSGPIEPVTPIIPIDPSNPTENKTTYLDVKVNVLKWVTRNNKIEF